MGIFRSTNGYLRTPYTAMLLEDQNWHQGDACRLWGTSFILQNIVGRNVLDVLCGKNIIGSYLVNHGYNAVGVDGGFGAFQHARTKKKDVITFNDNFPVWVCPVNKMPFEDNSFDTVYAHDIFRWFCKDQRWLSSDFRFLSDKEIRHCQQCYDDMLWQVCRVARQRIILVDRVNIRTAETYTKNLDYQKVLGILELNGWDPGGSITLDGDAPHATTMIVDKIRKMPERNEIIERATYYFIGIVAERK